MWPHSCVMHSSRWRLSLRRRWRAGKHGSPDLGSSPDWGGKTRVMSQTFSFKGRGWGRCAGLIEDPHGLGIKAEGAELLPMTF